MIAKLITDKNNIVIGYQTKPISPKDKTFDLELSDIHFRYSYIDDSGNFISNKEAYQEAVKRMTEENRLAGLRSKREPLLLAFDKWEKAVLRGRETDSETVMLWYQDLLDLKNTAFESIPDAVKYYL